jgi:hypothetical protein
LDSPLGKAVLSRQPSRVLFWWSISLATTSAILYISRIYKVFVLDAVLCKVEFPLPGGTGAIGRVGLAGDAMHRDVTRWLHQLMSEAEPAA